MGARTVEMLQQSYTQVRCPSCAPNRPMRCSEEICNYHIALIDLNSMRRSVSYRLAVMFKPIIRSKSGLTGPDSDACATYSSGPSLTKLFMYVCHQLTLT